MPTDFQLRAAALVTQARKFKGLSQGEFGLMIGKTQPVVSKYERALIAVPGEIVVQCIAMLGLIEESGSTPSADDLAELVRKLVSDPARASLRRVLAGLVASLEQSGKTA